MSSENLDHKKLLPKLEGLSISPWRNSAFSLKNPTHQPCYASQADQNQLNSEEINNSSSSPSNNSPIFCTTCGQSHSATSNHLYFYVDIPDSDLLCGLCELPLIDPLDTKCGHTFCAACLKNHLAVQALCPFDHEIINFLECQQASNIVKRLLDKLVVHCPNSLDKSTCTEEAIFRCDLEAHLGVWCRAVQVTCPNYRLGCQWLGPKSELPKHRSACFNTNSPIGSLGEMSTEQAHDATSRPTSQTIKSPPQRPYVNAASLPSSPKEPVNATSKTAKSVQPVSMERQCSSHIPYSNVMTNETSSSPLSVPENYDLGTQASKIVPGEISAVTIDRRGQQELGISIVGGVDTPLLYIMVQEIYLDGLIAKDGRLHPGDQILEVNEIDLTKSTHLFARHVFLSIRKNQPVRFLVYRERITEAPATSSSANGKVISSNGSDRGEILSISLMKRPDKKLGIKIAGKKNRPGLYVLGLVSDGIAQLDGRIRRDDRILEINGQDLCEGRQEEAVKIITNSQDRINITLLRTVRPQTPEMSREESEKVASRHQSSAHSIGYPVSKKTTDCRSLTPSSTISSHRNSDKVKLIKGSSPSTISDQYPMRDEVEGSNSPRNLRQPSIECKCQERYVQIYKRVNDSLGMSVAGGMESQRGDTPVYVTGLAQQMSVAQSGEVMLGNVLLGVNNENLCGLTHETAVRVLKSCRLGTPQSPVDRSDHVVTLHLYQNCIENEFFEDSFSESGNFMPSWVFWLHLPRFCQLSKSIILTRNNDNKSLGFSVVGGSESLSSFSSCSNSSSLQSFNLSRRVLLANGSSQPIVVKTIVPNSPAHQDGRLKCGDLILEVNGISLVDVTHSRAVSILKSSSKSSDLEVSLKVVSWPGTIV